MIKTGERKTEGDFLLMKYLGKEFVAVNCCHNRVSTTHYLSGGYNYRVPTARCSRWWYCGACRDGSGVPGGGRSHQGATLRREMWWLIQGAHKGFGVFGVKVKSIA